jgi:IclR family acetate operon transcriptional repressor
LHCTGLGKSLVSFQHDEEIASILEKYNFSRFTKKTISSHTAFMTECARIRCSGYSIDDEEEELGVRCVAVPILSDGIAVAAISVTGTTAQIPPENIAEVVSKTMCAASRIAAQLQPARIRRYNTTATKA